MPLILYAAIIGSVMGSWIRRHLAVVKQNLGNGAKSALCVLEFLARMVNIETTLGNF